ncbi:unnamed protein product [Cunninghamella blakesleeana]
MNTNNNSNTDKTDKLKKVQPLDLRDASLEDLESLIAASAQRLANYRLRREGERQLLNDDKSNSSSFTISNSSSTSSSPQHHPITTNHHSPTSPSSSSKYRTSLSSLATNHRIINKEKFSIVSPTSPISPSNYRSPPFVLTSYPTSKLVPTSSSPHKNKKNHNEDNENENISPSSSTSTTSSSSSHRRRIQRTPITTASSSILISDPRKSNNLKKVVIKTENTISSPIHLPSSSKHQQQNRLNQQSRIRLRTLSSINSGLDISSSSLSQYHVKHGTIVNNSESTPHLRYQRQRTQSMTTSSTSSSLNHSLRGLEELKVKRRSTNRLSSNSNNKKVDNDMNKENSEIDGDNNTIIPKTKPTKSTTPSSSTQLPSTRVRLRLSSTTTRPPHSMTDTNKSTTEEKKKPARKRGKTLPGSLPTTLNIPIKLESLNSVIVTDSHDDPQHLNKTATRIPLPSTTLKSNPSSSSLTTSASASTTNGNTNNKKQQQSIPQSSYIITAPPGMITSTTKQSNISSGNNRYKDHGLRKQSSMVMRKSTSSVTISNHQQSHKSETDLSNPNHFASSSSHLNQKNETPSTNGNENKSTSNSKSTNIRTRKISTISTRTGMGVSASIKPVSSIDKVNDPRRKKIPTLHERLQALVDESNSWKAQPRSQRSTTTHSPKSSKTSTSTTTNNNNNSNNNSLIVIRGGGGDSANSSFVIDDSSFYSEDLDLSDSDGSFYDQRSNNKHKMKEEEKIRSPIYTGVRSPNEVIKIFKDQLTEHEITEIQDYEKIYYIGHPQCQKKVPHSQHHYDDERGDYQIVLRDHLAYRYEVLAILGKGSFGQVLKCFDHQLGQTVAVKLIRNKKRFHTQATVEINILKKLKEWDPDDKCHNVRIFDDFSFRDHLCIAFECLSINLYDFIKSNHFQGFSISLIRRFTTQILNSLRLLHKHKLIHCDLKPENILLKHPTKSTLKVIDFGSSCLETEKVYTYIQSRFYRAPEIICGLSYTMAIDMWSLGCILAELYIGYPLFPGENEQEQLACMMEVLDVPPPYIIEKSSRRKLFFDSQGQPRIIPNSKGRKRRPNTKSLELQCLKSPSDPLFVDFIRQCLKWDPELRITPEQAFEHPFITNIRNSTTSKKASK